MATAERVTIQVDDGDVTAGNPLPVEGVVSISGGVGTVEIANDAGNPIPVNGTVEVANDAGNPLPVNGTVSANLQPTTSGGSTPYVNLDLGTTGQVIKAAAGQLYNYFIYNGGATVRFVKFYDKATAPSQADTPVWVFGIPASSAANVAFPNGIAFANGISVRATTGVANSDTGAPGTNEVVFNAGYK